MRADPWEDEVNLCEDGHDEVCFEGRKCPVCTVKEELEAQLAQVTEQLNEALDAVREDEE